MNRSEMAQILEICFQRVKAGRTIDDAIADYPAQSEELRQLLHIMLEAEPQASEMGIPSSAQLNSRKRFLTQAEQKQQRSGAATLWGLLRFLRVNAGQIAFGLAAVILLLVALGSTGALPGGRLSPIEPAAEQPATHVANDPISQRAEEVVQMIQRRQTGKVNFDGYLNKTGQEVLVVANIPLTLSQPLEQQAQNLLNVYVEVTGDLGADGKVTVEKLDPRLTILSGTIEQMSVEAWRVGGKSVKITAASQISGTPGLGSQVILRTAQIKDSQQVLAVSGEVVSSTATAARPSVTPRPTMTPSVTPTQTAAPTSTPAVTSDDPPESTHEPEDEEDDDGGSHDDDDDDDDHSGEGGDDGKEGEDDSEQDG